MAGIALVGGGDVQRIFAGVQFIVVTRNAGAGDLTVVGERRFPRRGFVAGLTHICRRDMCDIFACRLGVVVAYQALRAGLRVIHRQPRHPLYNGVTGLAPVRGWQMGCRLARDISAVMTTDAIVHNIRVREFSSGGDPGPYHVTKITLRRGRHVIKTLALREKIVMACTARAITLRMFHFYNRLPNRGRMAGLTAIRRRHVSDRLAGRGTAFVATPAVPAHVPMIHRQHRQPTRIFIVADTATIRGGGVAQVFTRGLYTVVTTDARP